MIIAGSILSDDLEALTDGEDENCLLDSAESALRKAKELESVNKILLGRFYKKSLNSLGQHGC